MILQQTVALDSNSSLKTVSDLAQKSRVPNATMRFSNMTEKWPSH
jgi:hypothetical protein